MVTSAAAAAACTLCLCLSTGAAADGANGGWNPTNLDGLDSELCTIKKVATADLTAEVFAREYYGRTPVILSDAAAPSMWPVAYEKWRKQALIEEFGQREILVRLAPSSCLTDNGDCVAGDGKVRSCAACAQHAACSF